MGAPVGSVFEVTFRTLCANQRCLNVLHYVVETETSETVPAVEAEQLAIAADAALQTDFLNCLGTNCQLTEVVAQCIRDTLGNRFARQVLAVDAAGTGPAHSDQPNIAGVITKRTNFAGRWAVGSFHMPGVPINTADQGVWEPGGYKSALGVLAAELLESITTASGGVYAPVLYHPTGVPTWTTPLHATEVQDQVRVMRRRTVGLGI